MYFSSSRFIRDPTLFKNGQKTENVKAIAPTDFGALRAPLAIAPKWAGAPMTGSVSGGGDWRVL